MFHGSNTFADFQTALDTAGIDKDARAREGSGMDKNPLFQSGDELYRGVIHVEVPEIDAYVTQIGTPLTTAGAGFGPGQSGVLLRPVGRQSWRSGKCPSQPSGKPRTTSSSKGVGSRWRTSLLRPSRNGPKTPAVLKQIGVVTGFFAASQQEPRHWSLTCLPLSVPRGDRVPPVIRGTAGGTPRPDLHPPIEGMTSYGYEPSPSIHPPYNRPVPRSARNSPTPCWRPRSISAACRPMPRSMAAASTC